MFMPNLLTARDVCARLGGISRMTLWRHLEDPELNFPQPVMRIRKVRYWREADLVEWLEGMSVNA
ncbi:hypothetical protein XMV225_002719 [Aliiroseovarius sp. xm-v-225]|nr:hypothetical protein [Aliiroseovarius sp. xm-m-378]NRP66407.1 hypothetical protein [Aliiroseovarius sp. xm-v-225]NRP93431.1 hypothetical protein [Aliiroseovarius sp. xm-a-134]